jgi:hypothetical protein
LVGLIVRDVSDGGESLARSRFSEHHLPGVVRYPVSLRQSPDRSKLPMAELGESSSDTIQDMLSGRDPDPIARF